jgi:hypothetical protein
MKSTLAYLLILLLVVPASARQRTPQEQAKRIAPCSRVVVELKSGRSYFGQLGEVTDTKLTLEPQPRELTFQDISRIRSVEPGRKEIVLKPLRALALVPLVVVCGISAVFKKPCDDL